MNLVTCWLTALKDCVLVLRIGEDIYNYTLVQNKETDCYMNAIIMLLC